jgi:hypothetical protein
MSMGLLTQYSTLQFLDLLTTMLFLSLGVQEGNPVVVHAIRWADNPVSALVGVKAIALAIGLYCWSIGRHSLLRRANWLFAALVMWNVAAIYMAIHQTS